VRLLELAERLEEWAAMAHSAPSMDEDMKQAAAALREVAAVLKEIVELDANDETYWPGEGRTLLAKVRKLLG
jgi:chaperonin cofactor prefoldin